MSFEKQQKKKRAIKKSVLCAYQTGFFAALLGLLFLIIAISIHSVFEIYIYDQRPSRIFHEVKVKVGLFGNTPLLIDNLNNVNNLRHPLEITDSRWNAAQMMVIIGILLIVLAIPVHVVSTSCSNWRKWWIVLIELCLYFATVIFVLISLALAENEIEVIHDADDTDLKRLLHRNGLMLQVDTATTVASVVAAETPVPVGSWGQQRLYQQYNLLLSAPMASFYLMVAAEFLALLAFLCSLVLFIRISEIDEQAKYKLAPMEAA